MAIIVIAHTTKMRSAENKIIGIHTLRIASLEIINCTSYLREEGGIFNVAHPANFHNGHKSASFHTVDLLLANATGFHVVRQSYHEGGMVGIWGVGGGHSTRKETVF